MSSSMNNSLPIQANNPVSNSSDFATRQGPSAGSSNAIRAQRLPGHEQATSSHRGRSGRSGRGRPRYNGPANRFDGGAVNPSNNEESSAQTQSEQRHSSDQPSSGSSKGMSGRVISYRAAGSRGGGSKYRQRNQTNQFLEGMSSYAAMDIDLVESIIPTDSSGRVNDSGRGRHATNTRKVNLTHLLNYKFERNNRAGRFQPTSAYNENNTDSRHRNVSSHYRDPGTVHKFSKQQFLQANCQFVVLDGHDYTIHKADPDWPVDWDCIEEVRFKQSASTETTCPICLEPPSAAKITRCGHIYCWTCMLHYLSLSDENCRQCPICFEPVYRSDLRSVVSHSYINHSVDEDIVMRLMIRKKGCVEVEPYKPDLSGYQDTPTTRDQTLPSDHYSSQANLVIVDPLTVVTKIAQRERDELLVKRNLEREEPEICFVEQAIDRLARRVDKLHQTNNGGGVKKIVPPCNSDPSTIPSLASSEPSKSYLFYQCSDGQPIYLNPFSTKILCHEFHSLENCPLEIEAKILQMDWISMSEAWRRRFKYLSHLPLTCEFRLIEIDFERSNLISQHTYKMFESQIKRREQERERRRREERKREKIIQVEQNRRIYGIQPSLKINLDNPDQFPSVSDERYLGLSQPRNKTRVDDEFFSSDEEDFRGAQGLRQASNRVEEPRDPPTSEPSSASAAILEAEIDVISNVAMSFKDIQIQEAAQEAKATNDSRGDGAPSSWTGKKKQGQSNSQSSFAQLLVNAKSSPKVWTKNSNPTNVSNSPAIGGSSGASQGAWSASAATHQRPRTASESEDGQEELRAPPCSFKISDFIDMNVVSTSGKKKSKSRATNNGAAAGGSGGGNNGSKKG